MRHQSIYELYPNVKRIDDFLGPMDINGNKIIVDEALVNAKIQELSQIKSLKLLRIERDRKLAEVDWWTSRALDGTPLTTEQTAYRQALRDLPENSANVAIDENGTLINVEWPVKPE